MHALEFIRGDEGCYLEPHIILEGNEEIGSRRNGTKHNSYCVFSSFKYYHIGLLDSKGSRVEHNFVDDKIWVVCQVIPIFFCS